MSVHSALSILLFTMLTAACARTQIDTTLPISHPANPAAEAAGFKPPPNPFALEGFETAPARSAVGSAPPQNASGSAGHAHQMPMMKPYGKTTAEDPKKATEHKH